jgi:hypothetical protein
VTAIVHVRGSFDKDEIEGLADTWLVECGGQASCPKEAIDAEMHLEQEFCT